MCVLSIEEIRLSHALLVCTASIIDGRSGPSLKAELRFKVDTSLHRFRSRICRTSSLLLLEELAGCGACKHTTMDSGSTLILSNHSDDLLYFSCIVKNGRFESEGASSLFVLGRVVFFRQILGEIVQHLLFLQFIWRRQYRRIGPSHTVTGLDLSEGFL